MQLAQCPRCQRYGWKGVVTGFNVLADATPLTTPEQFRDALLSQLAIYEIKGIAGADAKYLKVVSPRHLDGKRKAGATLVADHGCGAPARDAVPVEMAQQGPSVPACDVWRASGWSPPATCPRVGADAHTGLLFGDIKAPLSCKTCEPPPFDPKGPTCAPADTAAAPSAAAAPEPSTAPPPVATGLRMRGANGSMRPNVPYTPNTSHPNARAASRPTRCGTCRKLITGDELGIIGVEYDGRWQFAWHEAC